MAIVKSLKTPGYPHRIHQPKKTRRPGHEARRHFRRVLALKKARLEKLESKDVQEV
jgi:hypothetical protein